MIRDFDLLTRLASFDHLDALPLRRRLAVQMLRQAFVDLTITAASVAQSTGAETVDGLAGETITAGQSVYLNASNVWMRTQCDATALEAGSGGARTFGIALHASLNGQPLKVQVGGIITIGATVAVGTDYVISTALGGIAPRTDLVSTNRITHLGFADTTTTLNMVTKRYYDEVVP